MENDAVGSPQGGAEIAKRWEEDVNRRQRRGVAAVKRTFTMVAHQVKNLELGAEERWFPA